MSKHRLTPVQQGMLYHNLREPGSGVDIEQMIAELHEAVNPALLRRAWASLIERHAAFRTCFAWDNADEPLQFVEAYREPDWSEQDLSALSAAEQERTIAQFLKEDRARGFDLKQAPLSRCMLFRRDAASWTFVWTFHHISADGQSYPALLREGFGAYDALCSGQALPECRNVRPFGDFADWLTGHLQEARPSAEAFWRENLAGALEPTPLPGEKPAASQAIELEERAVSLSLAESEALRRFAEQERVTVNTCVKAAWALVLGAYARTDDVVYGETRACRRNTISGADEIVGTLINTAPLRIQIDNEATLADWLRRVRAADVALRSVEHTALTDIQNWTGLPLFDSLLVFTPRLLGAALREDGGAWLSRDIRFLEQTNFALTLFAYNEPALELKLAFDASRIDGAMIGRCLAELRTILAHMPGRAETKLGQFPLLGDSDRGELQRWNATDRAYDSESTIHSAFAACAAQNPDATAVVYRDRSLTYAALDARASQLARRLSALGATPNQPVGLLLRRSLDLPVAMLGVLKSGAPYLPLDPEFPAERLSFMIADTSASIIVTERALVHMLAAAPHLKIICIDEPVEAAAEAVPARASATDLAYVIFTSGSTGKPKGVMITHRNAISFFAGMDERLGADGVGTWLAVTSISFDISVLELLWTLTRGFKVVVQDPFVTQAADQPQAHGRLDFSLFYFAADAGGGDGNKYKLLLEGARYADQNGFHAIWTPERHFHAFGGLYPNPSVTSAAIAAVTSRIGIRAGSVVLPLHNPIRIAEEWSVVDNLSNGRIGLSFASGWHANDFALLPENYQNRKALMFSGIDTIRKLWRGDAVSARSGNGEMVDVRIFPAPIQTDPPLWVTASGNVETFRMAGEIGANLLTNLLGQTLEELQVKIDAYRKARRDHGHDGPGVITLMLHSYIGADLDAVRETVRKPFKDYLKTSTDLVQRARWEFPAFATRGNRIAIESAEETELSESDLDAVLDYAFERYFQTSGLFGTVETGTAMADKLVAIGVNEVACLTDFGVDTASVLNGLRYLNDLRARFAAPVDDEDYSIAAQIRRHNVTHLQCTPSLAGFLVENPADSEALRDLKILMVGGEALPKPLAERLTANLNGRLLNMYGPTETTIWSSTAEIGHDQPITIGRPIANTQIYIVDSTLRLLPAGMAGEILIGGAGVTNGYWGREALTAERFIDDSWGGKPGKLYRTGDLGRYKDDGSIEFLGRIDNQVKVSGHRIELGEIETVLSRHPLVKQAVVSARTDDGPAKLVAYVVAALQTAANDGGTDSVAHWQSLWDEAYRQADDIPDPRFNTAGWNDSAMGAPIPIAEMREWIDGTISSILALSPRRVLEIGCGTGMVLFRVAPHVEHYVGVDVSPHALETIRATLSADELTRVTLMQKAAHELDGLESQSLDSVIINSVAQYFPSPDYLERVLRRASEIVSDGGRIFVGDVRSLEQFQTFHADVVLKQAPSHLGGEEIARRIERRMAQDGELVLEEAFFHALMRDNQRITGVEVRLKPGRAHNEMTAFRYDVVLHVGESARRPTLAPVSAATLDEAAVLMGERVPAIVVQDVLNARVASIHAALAAMAAPNADTAALRAIVSSLTAGAVEPEDLARLNSDYDVDLVWARSGDRARFDAIFRLRGIALPGGVDYVKPEHRQPASRYANTPARGMAKDAGMFDELRNHAREFLPDYMIPSIFVTLDAFPLTPNGKIDRKALPKPFAAAPAAVGVYVPPSNALEETIAGVWRAVLGVERVGLRENIFDLGANSLLTMQANQRLSTLLERKISLVNMFRYTTVETLAAFLAEDQGVSAPSSASAERVQEREARKKDAAARRRELRAAGEA